MTKHEKAQSKIITERLHELEDIIKGKRYTLSKNGCGLCLCPGIMNRSQYMTNCTCPLNKCDNPSAVRRRIRLYVGISNLGERKLVAKEHHAFLIRRLKANGWEYVYE